MVPIETQYRMNTDTSSMYYFAGVKLNDGSSNICNPVSKEALLQRNKKTYREDNENIEEVCKGVRVKFTVTGCAVGHLFTIVMKISGLTTAEILFDKFLVFAIEGINLSDDVDIDSTQPDYVCFMCSNCAQLQLFE